jgi:hypothetical protein
MYEFERITRWIYILCWLPNISLKGQFVAIVFIAAYTVILF